MDLFKYIVCEWESCAGTFYTTTLFTMETKKAEDDHYSG